MQSLYHEYLKAPSRSNYLILRDACLNDADYDPCSRELDAIEHLVEEGVWDLAGLAIGDALPNLLLSPRLHLLAAHVSRAQGHHDAAEFESATALALVQGILSTGDGSKDTPYLVTRTSDEVDVCQRLGKFSERHLPQHKDGRNLDELKTSDGDAIWFDMTEPYHRYA